MKRTDLFILGGLVGSLVIFVFLSSQVSTTQNQTIVENQELIKEALNVSRTNTQLILDNQEVILHNSHTLGQHTGYTIALTRSMQDAVIAQLDIVRFLATNFNATYIQKVQDHHQLTENQLKILNARLDNLTREIRQPVLLPPP